MISSHNETDPTRIEAPIVYMQYASKSTIKSPQYFPLFRVNESYIDLGIFSDPNITSMKVRMLGKNLIFRFI